MGGELKASFALIRGSEAIVGPHVGDLEQAAVLGDYRAMLALYRQIFAFTPEVIAVDAHAGYLSTQLGEAMAAEWARGWCAWAITMPTWPPAWPTMVCGRMSRCWASCSMVSGWGTMAPCGAARFWWAAIAMQRVDGLAAVPLIGGSAAMREPWRNLLAQLVHAFGPDWRAHAGPVMAHLPPDADQADPRLRLAEAMIAGAPIARPVRLPGDCSRRWPPRWAFMPRARRSKGRRPWRSKPSRGHSWRAKRPIGRNPRSCPGAWGPICGALFWPTARQASRRGALLPAFTSPSPMRWRTVWPNRGGRGSASRFRAG
jgi:hypothetical protein